jgi:hypothetical protein
MISGLFVRKFSRKWRGGELICKLKLSVDRDKVLEIDRDGR